MATVLVCGSGNDGNPNEEIAVLVGRRKALVLPFVTTEGPTVSLLSEKAVELQLPQEEQCSNVQTSGAPSDDKEPPEDGTGAAGDGDEGRSRHMVASASVSAGGELLAVCCDERTVCVFSTDTWLKLHQWPAKRRVCTLCFSARGQDLLLADKTGDVYRYTCGEGFSETGELILGHISVLLDIGVSLDNRFLLSADRDEKIRVSRYPNAYNIESFCLGHTQFVSCIAVSRQHPNHFFSASGDGSVIMWQQETGQPVSRLDLPVKLAVSCLAISANGIMAVTQEATSDVHFISTEGGSLTFLQCVAVNGIALRIAFSRAGYLWVVSSNPQQPVQIIDVPGVVLSQSSLSSAVDLQPSLSRFSDLFEDCLHSHLDMSLLSKDPMDGKHRYFERKQERLQATTK